MSGEVELRFITERMVGLVAGSGVGDAAYEAALSELFASLADRHSDWAVFNLSQPYIPSPLPLLPSRRGTLLEVGAGAAAGGGRGCGGGGAGLVRVGAGTAAGGPLRDVQGPGRLAYEGPALPRRPPRPVRRKRFLLETGVEYTGGSGLLQMETKPL